MARLPAGDADEMSALIVNLVRQGRAHTRPQLLELTGLGRTAVTQRVEQAILAGLLVDAEYGPSTGGRQPRRLRFRNEAGTVLVAILGTQHVDVALTDLDGQILRQRVEPLDIQAGPEMVLSKVADAFAVLTASTGLSADPWAISLGIPGPVDFATGRPSGAPIMFGWENFDIRGWFAQRYEAPVWVDNDLNQMVLGQARIAQDEAQDVILVKISNGIGAGLMSQGRVHRGRNGAAGDIGHIQVSSDPSIVCRCGKTGCLEALAGGWALVRDASQAAREGKSAFLAERLDGNSVLEPADITEGARRADTVCLELVARAANLVGESLAGFVSFFNPGVVYVGGILPDAGDVFLAGVRNAVYQRSRPLATRDLQLLSTALNKEHSIRGAASVAIDELFDSKKLPLWLETSKPVAAGELIYAV